MSWECLSSAAASAVLHASAGAAGCTPNRGMHRVEFHRDAKLPAEHATALEISPFGLKLALARDEC
jgi:hypothetical protein